MATGNNDSKTEAPTNQQKEDPDSTLLLERFSLRSEIRFEDLRALIKPYSQQEDIVKFLENFQQVTEVLELTEKQKLLFCIKLLNGPISDYLQSKPIPASFEVLKDDLVAEFGATITPAEIHTKLKCTLKTKDETYQQFYYRMLKIASRANLDEASIKYYLIENIGEARNMKIQLRSCNTLQELKSKFILMDQEENFSKEVKISVPQFRRTPQQQYYPHHRQSTAFGTHRFPYRGPQQHPPGNFRPVRPWDNQQPSSRPTRPWNPNAPVFRPSYNSIRNTKTN